MGMKEQNNRRKKKNNQLKPTGGLLDQDVIELKYTVIGPSVLPSVMPAFAPVGDYTWNSDGYCTLICSLDGCCMWSCINQMHVWMYVRLDVWTPVQYIHVRLTHAHPNEYCMLDSHYAPKFW